MDPFLGLIQAFAMNWAPVGWMKCEGQSLSVEPNVNLYSLIGTTYGGDGRTTFALPDLRKEGERDKVTYCIAIRGIYPSRQ